MTQNNRNSDKKIIVNDACDKKRDKQHLIKEDLNAWHEYQDGAKSDFADAFNLPKTQKFDKRLLANMAKTAVVSLAIGAILSALLAKGVKTEVGRSEMFWLTLPCFTGMTYFWAFKFERNFRQSFEDGAVLFDILLKAFNIKKR